MLSILQHAAALQNFPSDRRCLAVGPAQHFDPPRPNPLFLGEARGWQGKGQQTQEKAKANVHPSSALDSGLSLGRYYKILCPPRCACE